MKHAKAMTFAWISTLITGCSSLPYGNFTQDLNAQNSHKIASDGAAQIGQHYPPAHTRLQIMQDVPKTDIFGSELIQLLRQNGFAIDESQNNATPNGNGRALTYVVDALSLYPNDRKAYVVVLNIDNESLSRIYQLSSDTLVPAGVWTRLFNEKSNHIDVSKLHTDTETITPDEVKVVNISNRVVVTPSGIYVRDAEGNKILAIPNGTELQNARQLPNEELPLPITTNKVLHQYTWGTGQLDNQSVLFPWELTQSTESTISNREILAAKKISDDPKTTRYVSAERGLNIRDLEGFPIFAIAAGAEINEAQIQDTTELPQLIAENGDLNVLTWGKGLVEGEEILFAWDFTSQENPSENTYSDINDLTEQETARSIVGATF